MAYKLGLDAKLFHGAAGSTASSEMKNCKDVTLNLETGEADITTRAAEGWRITAATLKDASLEFEMVWDTADAGFKAIKNAYFNNTAIALFASDGNEGSVWGAQNTFLAWYRDLADLTKEIEGIRDAMEVGNPSYSLQYSVKCKRNLFRTIVED